jgi:hypothetical protein
MLLQKMSNGVVNNINKQLFVKRRGWSIDFKDRLLNGFCRVLLNRYQKKK